MGRAPCCSKVGLHRGPWTSKEDQILTHYIEANGEGHWRSLPKNAGLLRCGKSCRLRWMNYLRPGIKRGNITPDEDDLIIRLHSLLGNRWSLIAGRLPGRTDNEIKNYWNSHLSKRFDQKVNDRWMKNIENKPRKGECSRYQESENGETGKSTTKVYQPKAVRVCSASPIARIGDFGESENCFPWFKFDNQAGMENGDDIMMLDDIFDSCGNLDFFVDSLLA